MTGFWQFIEHISTPVIAAATVVSYLALLQNQKALEREERRRMTATAIELNEKFSRETIGPYAALRCDYTALLRSTVGKSEEVLRLTLPRTFRTSATLHGNQLEHFALHIESRLADEELLFRVAGRPYCKQVNNLAALCGMTTDDAVESWPSVYNLHVKWAERLTNQVVPYIPPSLRARNTNSEEGSTPSPA
jgi:hypothetical protein